MRVISAVCGLGMAIAISGCATPELTSERLSSLGIPAEQVIARETSYFGITMAGSNSVTLREGQVVIAKSGVHFLTARKQEYQQALSLPFSKIESISLVKWGLVDQLRQIQLRSDFGVAVLSFNAFQGNDADRMFTQLGALGLKVIEAEPINDAGAGGPIPIFIPVK
jgi:hypothetical protein